MTDLDFTRRHFSHHASAWLEAAYGGARSDRYPVGRERVRRCLEAVEGRLGACRGRLVDMGCGGGDLCIEAAARGFDTLGIDSAAGMIDVAEARRATLPRDVAARIVFRVADVLDGRGRADAADAVTALGLVEYLDDDRGFLREAARLLRPGGVLVVSCRNRLFNLASLNDYTRREIEQDAASALLAEMATFVPGSDWRPALSEMLARLRDALPMLEAALAEDVKDAAPARAEDLAFRPPRRQHTPRELATAAAAAGFNAPAFVAVHPHPFPPALESQAPRFYNGLAGVLEVLGRSPASLAWSSTFLGIFTR